MCVCNNCFCCEAARGSKCQSHHVGVLAPQLQKGVQHNTALCCTSQGGLSSIHPVTHTTSDLHLPSSFTKIYATLQSLMERANVYGRRLAMRLECGHSSTYVHTHGPPATTPCETTTYLARVQPYLQSSHTQQNRTYPLRNSYTQITSNS